MLNKGTSTKLQRENKTKTRHKKRGNENKKKILEVINNSVGRRDAQGTHKEGHSRNTNMGTRLRGFSISPAGSYLKPPPDRSQLPRLSTQKHNIYNNTDSQGSQASTSAQPTPHFGSSWVGLIKRGSKNISSYLLSLQVQPRPCLPLLPFSALSRFGRIFLFLLPRGTSHTVLYQT